MLNENITLYISQSKQEIPIRASLFGNCSRKKTKNPRLPVRIQIRSTMTDVNMAGERLVTLPFIHERFNYTLLPPMSCISVVYTYV